MTLCYKCYKCYKRNVTDKKLIYKSLFMFFNSVTSVTTVKRLNDIIEDFI